MSWKRKYILSGFESKEAALDRSRQFALKAGIDPDAATKYLFSVEPLFREHWGLVVPEENVIDNELDKYVVGRKYIPIFRTGDRHTSVPYFLGNILPIEGQKGKFRWNTLLKA
ncbi:MAG: hypothetical protein RL308_115 [Bacteroidota bacterium]|jgi:hypothetical protein